MPIGPMPSEGTSTSVPAASLLGELALPRRAEHQLDQGMLLVKAREHVGENRRRERLDAAYAERPRHLAALPLWVAHGLDGPSRRPDELARVEREGLAPLGELCALWRPVEEARPELALELLDLHGDGGLRVPERRRRAREAPQPRHL